VEHSQVKLGRAGRKRLMGRRPSVRGTVMNPRDHPHGGGEGRAPIGLPGPRSPWGKPTLGARTRRRKDTNKYIVRRRYQVETMSRSTKKGPFADAKPIAKVMK